MRTESIYEFQGEHRWLSNFWPARVSHRGMTFNSSEAAYQAAKSDHVATRATFMALPGTHDGCQQAKRMGRQLVIRPDWDKIKIAEMRDILCDKFIRNRDLGEKLAALYGVHLEEGNNWKDRYWGVSPPRSGQGRNELGKLLMWLAEKLNIDPENTMPPWER